MKANDQHAHGLFRGRLWDAGRVLFCALLIAILCASAGCQPQSDQTDAHPTEASQAAEANALTFRTDDRLEDHFKKHGAEVGCSTPEEYLACANAVIDHPDALHKTQREDGDDAYFLERTGEFVVVSPDGFIRTYFITDMDYFRSQ
ncbi:MAG: hypothetical protein HFJ65_05930 [Eggerthellaceae bacterium]|nr:hypothetical protein [Eggerthellaceae bacterium]